MTRTELAAELNRLAKDGELVSVEGFRYANHISRTTASKRLSDENIWLRVYIEDRVFYLKNKE